MLQGYPYLEEHWRPSAVKDLARASPSIRRTADLDPKRETETVRMLSS
jgi:hypothetical protein